MFLLGTVCVAWCVFAAFLLLLTSKLFGRQPLNHALFRMLWFTGRVAPVAAAALYALGAALRHQVKYSCILGLIALALAFFILPLALVVLRSRPLPESTDI